VTEKFCWYSAKKLVNRMNKNKEMIIGSVLFSVLLRENLISFLNINVIVDKNFFHWLDDSHSFLGPKIRMNGSANQDVDIIDDLGSKTENRFVIILFFCGFGGSF